MSEYDKILKEKKKQDLDLPQKEKIKKFPWFQLDVFFIILILVISYLIYYHTVLNPKNILITDTSKLIQKYQIIWNSLSLNSLNTDYFKTGTIQLEQDNYHYSIIRNADNLKFELTRNDHSLSYYQKETNRYIKLSTLEEDYIQLENNSYLNYFSKIKQNFDKNITEDKYIKKFYLDGTAPIIEVNLELKNEDIAQILNNNQLKDQYEVLISFKNNALTNDMTSMKITINNLTQNKRWVIIAEDGALFFSDGELKNLKFVLTQKEKDFTLKIYQNEVLYSVLTGVKQEENYQYIYQIIDKLYTLTLNKRVVENGLLYEFSSVIEENGETSKKSASISIENQNKIILEEDKIATFKQYDTLSKEEQEKYETSLNDMIGNLRQFIKEYKESINQIEDDKNNR